MGSNGETVFRLKRVRAFGGDSRETETPVVVSAQAARLADVLDTAREHGAGLALIDSAPHAEAAALAAARAADMVLVPLRPPRGNASDLAKQG